MARITPVNILRAQAAIIAGSATVGAGSGNTVTADSASLADVQTAVNAASDGDTVLIPNGSATWTGGISTTKQIRIEAQNYTPTSMGTMTRNVTITNNSASPLITMASGNSHHVGVGGIRFNSGTQNTNHVKFTGSGSKPPLIYDCAFEQNSRFGSAEDVALVNWLALGGVCWNTRVDGSSFPASGVDAGPAIAGECFHFKSPRLWNTASTLGTLDTNGDVNVYFEDCTLYLTQSMDVDDHARVVVRHCLMDGSPWITHGPTSLAGGRALEFYDNTFQNTQIRNMARRYTWLRCGTGVYTENTVLESVNTQEWGGPLIQVDMGEGPNVTPTAYPHITTFGTSGTPGWGHNGSGNIVDPIYLWNQTGPTANAYGTGVQTGWESNILEDRDFFVNSGAKPGWTKPTGAHPAAYPHPFRSQV